MKLTRVFIAVFILVLISNINVSQLDTNKLSNSTALTSNSLTSYTNHTAILIYDETDFSLQGFPGNGSITNPYVIEGLSIVAN